MQFKHQTAVRKPALAAVHIRGIKTVCCAGFIAQTAAPGYYDDTNSMDTPKMTPTLHPKGKRAFLSLWAWRIVGGAALFLGAIGVVLPLLPTTPFVILAAFAFAKSAPALHAKLVQSPTFGPAIARWQAKGAIAARHKAMAIGMMLAAFIAAVAVGAPVFALVLQVVFMSGSALFILTRPNG